MVGTNLVFAQIGQTETFYSQGGGEHKIRPHNKGRIFAYVGFGWVLKDKIPVLRKPVFMGGTD